MGKSITKSLRNRVILAGSWTMFVYVASQILRLVGNIVLTRLLVPEMFGIMALASVILMGLNLFTDVGLLQNVVQSRRGDDLRFLNVVWVVQIARGALLSIITFLLSWLLLIAGEEGWLPISSAYSNPVLPAVVAAFALIPLISGFNSSKLMVANRKLNLGKVAVLELISQIFGLIIMIVWAWHERTIWALVGGNIATTLLKMILSHTNLDGAANRFEWDQSIFYEIFHFGKWIFISSILGFLSTQGDKLLLGGMISAEKMGIYSIAFFLANAGRDALMKLSGTVFYPALSEVVRDNPEKLSEVYYKIRRHIDAFTFFFSGFLIMTGSTIVKFLYDERYIDAGWMLQILSISLASVGFLTAGQVCMALGHVEVISILAGIRVLVLYISIPLLFLIYGMQGAVWAIAISPIFIMVGYMWFLKKFNVFKLQKEFIMFPMLIIGITTGLIVNYIFNTFVIIK